MLSYQSMPLLFAEILLIRGNTVTKNPCGYYNLSEANDSCEDEPDIKKLRLGKQCSVEDLECTLCCR